jgi:hypothetical protein
MHVMEPVTSGAGPLGTPLDGPLGIEYGCRAATDTHTGTRCMYWHASGRYGYSMMRRMSGLYDARCTTTTTMRDDDARRRCARTMHDDDARRRCATMMHEDDARCTTLDDAASRCLMMLLQLQLSEILRCN